jgi:hypothetical protein
LVHDNLSFLMRVRLSQPRCHGVPQAQTGSMSVLEMIRADFCCGGLDERAEIGRGELAVIADDNEGPTSLNAHVFNQTSLCSQ